MKARAKLYVSSPSVEGVFGEGKWRLLRAVGEHGSIRGAAGALDRSYRKAWGDIVRAQEALGWPLVERRRGGRGGGRTVLTPACEALLEAWERHRRAVEKCMERSYRENLEPFFESRSSIEGAADVGAGPTVT